MKFKAFVSELYGRNFAGRRRTSCSHYSVVTLAIDRENNASLVVVLKLVNEEFPRIIRTDEILSVNTTLVSEGKVTFTQGLTSLLVEAQPTDMRRLVTILDCFLSEKHLFDEQYSLPDLSSLGQPRKGIDILHITSADQLPSSEGYSKHLTCLSIKNVEMEKFDSRLLRLQHLRSLTLKSVGLETIPNQLDLLPDLNTLNLSGNRLGLTSNWRWICCSTLRENLLRLDLSDNQMRDVPFDVCRLSHLEELNLSRNLLTLLPNGIGLLKNLRNLLLKGNEMEWFPCNVLLLMRLEQFDFSHAPNRHVRCQRGNLIEPCTTAPRLVDLAATVVINNRLKYSEEQVPRFLCDYMDNAIACICRRLMLPPTPNCFTIYPIKLGSRFRLDQDYCYVLGYRQCKECLIQL